jgi:hypothetical protein
VTLHRLVRRHRVLVSRLAVAGALLGSALAALLPPPVSAVCEVRAAGVVTDGAPDGEGRSRLEERAFEAPALLRATLEKLGLPDPDGSAAGALGARLRLERLGDGVYQASYRAPRFDRRAPPVKLLATHLEGYLAARTEAAVRLFRAEAQALRSQLDGAAKDLARLDRELKAFAEANGDGHAEGAPRAEGPSPASVAARLHEIVNRRDTARRLYDQLLESHKRAVLTFNLERIAAQARHQIVGQPRLERPSMIGAGAAGGALGLGLALVLAAPIAAYRERRHRLALSAARLT